MLYTNGRTPHTHFPGPCLHGYNSPSSHRTNYKYFNIFTYPLSVGREAIILENRLQYKNIATSITLPVMYVSWKRQILGWKSAEGNWIYVYIFIIYIYFSTCMHECTMSTYMHRHTSNMVYAWHYIKSHGVYINTSDDKRYICWNVNGLSVYWYFTKMSFKYLFKFNNFTHAFLAISCRFNFKCRKHPTVFEWPCGRIQQKRRCLLVGLILNTYILRIKGSKRYWTCRWICYILWVLVVL